MRFRPIRGRGRHVKIGDSARILTLRYWLDDHGGWPPAAGKDPFATDGNPFQRRPILMTEGVAYCGLSCQSCPIHMATRQENKKDQARMRVEIVERCKEQYGINYTLEDITDCDGCRTESGRLFSASKNCPIRKCAREKKLENCAYCTEYACGKLETFFSTETSAKTRLEAIRSRIL